MKIVYNRLLGGWYVVRGKNQTPLSGRFESKQDAELYLRNKQNRQEIHNEKRNFKIYGNSTGISFYNNIIRWIDCTIFQLCNRTVR